MDIQNGDLVTVKAYGGDVIVGRLMEVREWVAIVSTDEELKAAEREQREPICIGSTV